MPRPSRGPKQLKPERRREPKRCRPEMPKSYRIPTSPAGLLSWSHATERMAHSRNYWIGTTRPDGRPHVMPVWGLWMNETLYFGTDHNSRKARNLAANRRVVAHLESGDDVVILEGVAREVTDPSLLRAIDDAYFAKYRIHLLGYPGDPVIYAVHPRVAFAWQERNFNRSATRWILNRK